MKKSLVFTALLAATPLALLLPGCSGGGLPGLPFPTATPKPAVTATPVPTVSQTSNFTLGNGQRAILKTTRNGTSITGTMQILAPLGQIRTKAGLGTSIKIGTYTVSGTFTPARGFSITVKDGNATLFSMSGLFPTASETGSYTLSFGGETDSGIIPKIGDVAPTATPKPTTTATASPSATPSTTALNGTYKFTVQNGSGSNFEFTSIEGSDNGSVGTSKPFFVDGFGNVDGTGIGSPGFTFLGTGPSQNFQSTLQTRGIRILFAKQGALKAGDVIPVKRVNNTTLCDIEVQRYFPTDNASSNNLKIRRWYSYSDSIQAAQNGTVTVTAVTPKTISVTIKNLLLAPSSVETDSTEPQGTLTVNGSFTVNNYRQS